jgi:hypothetical protein
MRHVRFFLCLAAALVCLSRAARAETIEAPVGGKSIALGDARVACAAPVGGWKADAGSHTVRPPVADLAIGVVTDLRVSPSLADCARATTVVKLIATAAWPAFDGASFTLALDEGRLEGSGHGLHGVLVAWPTDTGQASDACRDLRAANGVETCAWGVPKTLSADLSTSSLRWLPAGAQSVPDAAIFDAEGRSAPPEAFLIAPTRIEVLDLLPSDASVDVSSGIGRAPLKHAEAIAGVDCGTGRCSVDSGQLVMLAPPASVAAVDVKFRLSPHVFYTRKNPPDPQPVLRVSILRCPMSVVSGPALRGVDSSRAVVRVEGGCMHDFASLRFFVGGRQADVTQTETAKDAAYAVVSLGNIDAPNVSITAVRGEGEGTVVAVARTDTRAPPVVRTVIEIPTFPPIDFVPNNRNAVVHFPRVQGAELALLPIEGVYDAKEDAGVTTVQGDVNAVGSVVLQFGYRVASLPAPLDKVNLAVLSDALQRSVKEANVPAPFGATALTVAPLVEVVCKENADAELRAEPGLHAKPGVTLHLPFEARDGCRVIIHRERLSPEYGTQKLSLEIEVNKLDGTPRPDGHITQTLILRAGDEPRIAWIKGVIAPYDRAVIRLSLVADEAHYLGAGDIVSGAPMVQWSILFGTGHVRLYATTAIPTGLYRFGNATGSGVLSLSVAVISRLTWLDSEGHEGLLGLEAGVMAFGFTNSAAQSISEAGIVAGVGLSIPLAGAGSPTQASINLHAWVEQRISEAPPAYTPPMGTKPLPLENARAVIVGPSISFGNLGTTF